MSAVLTVGDQALLVRQLRSVAPSWFEIGIRLQLSAAVLESIDTKYGSNEEKLSAVVREWLRIGGREANWQTLSQVLRSSGHSALASKLETQYSSPTTAPERGKVLELSLHSTGIDDSVTTAPSGRPKLAQLAPIPLSTSQCRQLAMHLRFSVSHNVQLLCYSSMAQYTVEPPIRDPLR